MSEGFQHLSLPDQLNVPIVYDATDGHLVPFSLELRTLTSATSQLPGHPATPQETTGFSGTHELPYPPHSVTFEHLPFPGATHSLGAGEPMALKHNDVSSQEFSDINIQDLSPFDDVDELWSWIVTSNKAEDPPSTPTDLSAHSPDGSPAAGPPVINIEPAKADRKVVGSLQIRQAAAKRRKSEANIKCPFSSVGCSATFTTRHNLRYHLNSHRGEKPYKCNKCSYAASSPATMKRHQNSCKVTSHSTEGNVIP